MLQAMRVKAARMAMWRGFMGGSEFVVGYDVEGGGEGEDAKGDNKGEDPRGNGPGWAVNGAGLKRAVTPSAA
jgi:hypothetical protein